MTLRTEFIQIEEPGLEFRYGQAAVNPHRGLALFGPYDADLDPPGRVTHSVVGTGDGIAAFARFAEALARPVLGGGLNDDERRDLNLERNRRKHNALWPDFPGFGTAFATQWRRDALTTGIIDANVISQELQNRDDHRRVHAIADLYLDRVRIASERDNPPSAVICVVPDGVWLHCRPQSRVTEGFGERTTKSLVAQRRVIGDLFGDYDPEEYELSTDFRRQIKARSLTYRMPIQLVLESTLNLDPGTSGTLTPLTDRAWNLSTALYYKAGGRPWRLASARPGVCYIGLTFKRQDPDNEKARTAACAAQMFLDTGDGIVFRGESGPWYSPTTRDYTLGRDEARKPHLLTYDGWMVPAPIRIDMQHGTSDIRQVARDILGLTKLNYNACRAGDAMPVTVKFSDRVGEILITNPTIKDRQPNFKYYI